MASKKQTNKISKPKNPLGYYPSSPPKGMEPYTTSPRKVLAPFYGKALEKEAKQAQAHVQKTFPDRLAGNNVSRDLVGSGQMLQRLIQPNFLDTEIKVQHKENPDSWESFRANADAKDNMIQMGEPFKYGEFPGKKIQMLAGDGRTVDLPSQRSYAEVLNHETGHLMYPDNRMAVSWARDVGGEQYFQNPAELVTELAHAQRQRFKATGQRFTSESFAKFLQEVEKDPKLLESFSGSTQSALKYLLDKSFPDAETDRTKAIEFIPGLVGMMKSSNLT